ncbi:MAG: nitroreductase family protein [Eubacteriaceae bacterium]|nr:nitroreductase family protein [Eubacteriaceae bacterium]
MEFKELIKLRRSIRAYKEGVTITTDELKELMLGVQEAPSWANTQTGRYYIVSDPEKCEKVKGMLKGRNAENTKNAAAYIITAFEKGKAGFFRGEAANELGDMWGAYDLGLAGSYLILKARDMGYDSLIMGVRDADALRAEFSIPEDQEIAAVIALGVRESDPAGPKHLDPDVIAKYF